ncbi:MAG: DNA-binding protein [Actinomycetia bacterium]|nr:DNA-binding protein [Actinomycetes bacterium]MCP4223061.1 DNA-binding protein [Actinomycetes bacterium]MCP5034927.1 DNA-binding protein [Actinomycetes bacterium]
MSSYLNPGLPKPVPSPDGLDGPFWEGLNEGRLLLQRCGGCGKFQWGPEWVCHRCRSFDLSYEETPAEGIIYSHQRVWHPVHPALAEQGPYVIVLVELPAADGVRIVGNLIGDPHQDLVIGTPAQGVFEHHLDDDPAHTLLHWTV